MKLSNKLKDELIQKRAKAFVELRHIRDSIEADIGHKWLIQLESLKITYEIFNDNLAKLIQWTLVENYPEFEMPPDKPSNAEKASSYFQEFVRLLHNTLTSITTYTEHSRRIMKKIAATHPKFFNLYNAQVKQEFKEDPLTNYLKGFRNYLTHIDLVDHFVHHHYDFRHGDSSIFVLDTAKLKKWNGWNDLGRQYVGSLDQAEISIQSQLEGFRLKLLLIRSWFGEQMEKYLKDSLSITRDLYAKHESVASFAYEEHVKAFGPTEDMKIPGYSKMPVFTAHLPPT